MAKVKDKRGKDFCIKRPTFACPFTKYSKCFIKFFMACFSIQLAVCVCVCMRQTSMAVKVLCREDGIYLRFVCVCVMVVTIYAVRDTYIFFTRLLGDKCVCVCVYLNYTHTLMQWPRVTVINSVVLRNMTNNTISIHTFHIPELIHILTRVPFPATYIHHHHTPDTRYTRHTRSLYLMIFNKKWLLKKNGNC